MIRHRLTLTLLTARQAKMSSSSGLARSTDVPQVRRQTATFIVIVPALPFKASMSRARLVPAIRAGTESDFRRLLCIETKPTSAPESRIHQDDSPGSVVTALSAENVFGVHRRRSCETQRGYPGSFYSRPESARPAESRRPISRYQSPIPGWGNDRARSPS